MTAWVKRGILCVFFFFLFLNFELFSLSLHWQMLRSDSAAEVAHVHVSLFLRHVIRWNWLDPDGGEGRSSQDKHRAASQWGGTRSFTWKLRVHAACVPESVWVSWWGRKCWNRTPPLRPAARQSACLLLLMLWLKLQRRCDRVISWEPWNHLLAAVGFMKCSAMLVSRLTLL